MGGNHPLAPLAAHDGVQEEVKPEQDASTIMDERKFMDSSWFCGGNDPKQYPAHFFFRTLHMDFSTAQRADVSKQNFSVVPRHWYIDADFECIDCRKAFTFSADEQRFWYEDRQFWVDSTPSRCVKCRKAQRNKLKLKQRYDALIAKALRGKDMEAKKEIVQIVDELEAAGLKLPLKMKGNRALLYAQLRKFAERAKVTPSP
jgi:hypothetical protein